MGQHRPGRTRAPSALRAPGHSIAALVVLAFTACGGSGLSIVDRPIPFSEQRQAMTRAYIAERYGIETRDITIVPRMIVLHWTAIDGLEASYRAFAPEALAGRPDLTGAGDVNVSIQFLVDMDGTVYRLMPETWMARHVIGLNYHAIGIENVGGADGVDNLTDAQIEANIRLVRYLARKYPTIEYLIGHHEYQLFDGHPLWRELDSSYRTVKIDPGDRFMNAVRAGAAELELKGPPAATGSGAAATSWPGERPRRPQVIPHAAWASEPPVGHAADATRRNLAPGDSLRFHSLTLGVHEMTEAGEAVVSLSANGRSERRTVRGDVAFRWDDFRIAVLAVNGGTGLGAGLVELEVATTASLPASLAESDVAGDALHRLRVPHEITTITLHHTGSPQPLGADEDPVQKLRGLQSWGRAERNWWDVPYHYLIDLEGRIYEGRDHRYMGETNTRYDPRGHLLISVIGNYDLQEPTAAQIRAVTELMTWAAAEFDVPVDRIRGHGDLADTSCPGEHLRRYLVDGTFHRAVSASTASTRRGPARR